MNKRCMILNTIATWIPYLIIILYVILLLACNGIDISIGNMISYVGDGEALFSFSILVITISWIIRLLRHYISDMIINVTGLNRLYKGCDYISDLKSVKKEYRKRVKGGFEKNDEKWRKRKLYGIIILRLILSIIYLLCVSKFFINFERTTLLWVCLALYTIPHIIVEFCWHISMLRVFCFKCALECCFADKDESKKTDKSYDYREKRIGSIGSVGVYARDWYTKTTETTVTHYRYTCPICGKEKHRKDTSTFSRIS